MNEDAIYALAMASFNPFARKYTLWQRFCRWLHYWLSTPIRWLIALDKRFMYRRIVILYNPDCISRRELSAINVPGTHITVVAVLNVGNGGGPVFHVWEIDRTPKAKYDELMAQIEAANRRSEEPHDHV